MKVLLLTIFFSVSVSSNVLDDLIVKKKPEINQIIIELLKSGMSEEWESFDSSISSKIGTDICKAGGGRNCSLVTNIGYGICKAGGGRNCSLVNSVQEGINKIPYVDRTYWWDKFRDQYGNNVWRCRGGQTKQFAENSKCSGLSKDDERWPG